MTKTAITLEDHLRDRLSDRRATLGALEISADRVLLQFGAVDELPRITLAIDGDAITVVAPDDLADAPQGRRAAKPAADKGGGKKS